ncbi:MAG TPA: nucleoside-diphosphate sugar epimerase/dehydratase [Vicinamibacterales bacterium]|nr:nucleoside-diphosphate sugar epimerase/dehydratase [Vicinamibacterales bacterium]
MRNRYVFVADLALIPIIAMVAYLGRFDWGFLEYREEFSDFVIAAMIIKPLLFIAAGMYRRYWRYTSVHDLATVVLAITAASIAMTLYVMVRHTTYPHGFSRVVLFNDWLITLAMLGGLRVVIRIAYDKSMLGGRGPGRSTPKRVLVAGAGAAGTMVVRELRSNAQLGMNPVGYVDDDVTKIGKYISGLPVLGSTRDLPHVVRQRDIEHVVIAMPTARGSDVRQLLDRCRDASVSAQTIPGLFELLGGRATVSRLRTVDIEDLLRRSPVVGGAEIGRMIARRVVMITGGGGSIGYELSRQVANLAPAHVILLGHGENSLFEAEARLRRAYPGLHITVAVADIRDRARLATVFDRWKVDLVIHAAAHKHVPLMEQNPEEAVTNNIIGTRNLVQESLRTRVGRFVLISTDKAVAPTSIMGASKRIAEAIVRQAAQRSGRAFVVVRFGNVLGSRGSVVNTFKAQIERGGPLTVTHPEMTRYFMTIPEAVHLVLQATGAGRGGELFVLDMGEPVRIVDLARDLISLSGLNPEDIEIVFTGIRPGEKLHERLFDAGMETRPTIHPDVLEVVGADACVTDTLDEAIDQLYQAARAGDEAGIYGILATLLPSFGKIPSWPNPMPPDWPATQSQTPSRFDS